MMMTNVFAPMTAYAQAACAVSACSDNSIILPMDAIALASIIILPFIILVHHFPICRIPVQRPVSLSIL